MLPQPFLALATLLFASGTSRRVFASTYSWVTKQVFAVSRSMETWSFLEVTILLRESGALAKEDASGRYKVTSVRSMQSPSTESVLLQAVWTLASVSGMLRMGKPLSLSLSLSLSDI